MAQQATSPSMSLQDGSQDDHPNPPQSVKSNSEVPVDPNIAASSPTYPPYSPYAPHDMSHYQGHPPPGYPQHWPQQHPGYSHGMPAPYSSPGSAASGTPASAGPRPGQVSHPAFFSRTVAYLGFMTVSSPAVPGIFIRSDSRCTTAQASPSPVRRDRAYVQMRLARL